MESSRSMPHQAWPPLVVAVVGLLIGLAGYLHADPPPATDLFYLRGAGGAVLFRHADHQHRGITCEQCHHEVQAGSPVGAHNCRACHPAEAGESLAEGTVVQTLAEAYHSRCNGCHLRTAAGKFADAEGKPACHACHLK